MQRSISTGIRQSPNPLSKQQIRQKITSLKRSQRFVDWRGIHSFAVQLDQILHDIEQNIRDPKEGTELVLTFMRCDSSVFNRCDDSSGIIGDIFRYRATDLFVKFAAVLDDNKWLADRLFNMLMQDDYGVRDSMLAIADQILPEIEIRKLVERFSQHAEKLEDKYTIRSMLGNNQILAKCLNDPVLYEKTVMAAYPKPVPAFMADIAEQYLKADDPETALNRLDRTKGHEDHQIDRIRKLRLQIQKCLGNQEACENLAWTIFINSRQQSNLNQLLDVVGQQDREAIINKARQEILKGKRFSMTDARFLIESRLIYDTENYILKHANEMEHQFYGHLLPIAEVMELNERYLAASVIYRGLIKPIMDAAVSKNYHHAVRYMRRLDAFALRINDWQDVVPHAEYQNEFRKQHLRKVSFWSRYEK